MAFTHLNAILQTDRAVLMKEWLEVQLSAETARLDLVDESTLREESARFIQLLTAGLPEATNANIKAPSFKPLLNLLEELSQDRSRQGFTPAEVATFIFSFKQPLFSRLGTTLAKDPEALAQELWDTTVLLDKLGLYTMDVFQQSREEVIRRQQEEMLELSTPVVQLWKGIVALPLIGTLDSARTSVVMESLLQTITQTGSEIAIVDITGVPTVDTLVAQHLLKTVAAARLMGADCIISGIRPQIAQTMVHLQIDLGSISTRATMADALQLALRRLKLKVVSEGPSTVEDRPF